MKVAVYSIALNEAKHAKRWADSAKYADYLFVLDTGSTDDTVKILEENGVNVAKAAIKPWRFDVARNTALALLPEDIDIVVSLDMDEVLDKNFIKNVKKAWVPGTTSAWITMDTGTQWKADRVHSRHGFVWKSPIHEVAVPSLGTENKHVIVDATITHLPDNDKPRIHYLEMLKSAVEEDPTDTRLWFYLTREYWFNKDYENVIKTAENVIKQYTKNNKGWNVEVSAACRLAGSSCQLLDRKSDALVWFNSAAYVAQEEMENWFYLALAHYEMENYEAGYEVICNMDSCKNGEHYLIEPEVWAWKAWDIRAQLAWHTQKPEEARIAAKHAYKANPTDNRLANNYKFFNEVSDGRQAEA